MRWWIRGSGPGNPIGQVGGGALVIGLALVCAVLGARITPHDPLRYDARSTLKGPSPAHLLGTDPLGRDVPLQVRIVRRVVRDHRDVGCVALVARTRVGQGTEPHVR